MTAASRVGERGVALVFALAALTLVALTIAAVVGELQSRGVGVVIEERNVRVVALCDAAVAETIAGLAEQGSAFPGLAERRFADGLISSTVRPMGEWEAEVVATGRRGDWQSVAHLRVHLQGTPRVLWWERKQGGMDLEGPDDDEDDGRLTPAPVPTFRMY